MRKGPIGFYRYKGFYEAVIKDDIILTQPITTVKIEFKDAVPFRFTYILSVVSDTTDFSASSQILTEDTETTIETNATLAFKTGDRITIAGTIKTIIRVISADYGTRNLRGIHLVIKKTFLTLR